MINKYGNLSIQYKEKLVKLIEYKQNIVVFLQSVIFEFDENLQLKMKNHTPTMNKKYKHELMEDTLDFKNNFFSLVLYIMKDLDDIDVFKVYIFYIFYIFSIFSNIFYIFIFFLFFLFFLYFLYYLMVFRLFGKEFSRLWEMI